ncbi:hypothetical protein Leryth_001432 [Lithospermum erythrorhizon]|nr:hypothetical protein Leryth_001432 [Lithospermum erythrorhizon]
MDILTYYATKHQKASRNMKKDPGGQGHRPSAKEIIHKPFLNNTLKLKAKVSQKQYGTILTLKVPTIGLAIVNKATLDVLEFFLQHGESQQKHEEGPEEKAIVHQQRDYS